MDLSYKQCCICLGEDSDAVYACCRKSVCVSCFDTWNSTTIGQLMCVHCREPKPDLLVSRKNPQTDVLDLRTVLYNFDRVPYRGTADHPLSVLLEERAIVTKVYINGDNMWTDYWFSRFRKCLPNLRVLYIGDLDVQTLSCVELLRYYAGGREIIADDFNAIRIHILATVRSLLPHMSGRTRGELGTIIEDIATKQRVCPVDAILLVNAIELAQDLKTEQRIRRDTYLLAAEMLNTWRKTADSSIHPLSETDWTGMGDQKERHRMYVAICLVGGWESLKYKEGIYDHPLVVSCEIDNATKDAVMNYMHSLRIMGGFKKYMRSEQMMRDWGK